MKKLIFAMLATVTICLAGQGARAEVPYLIPVLGMLTDGDEAPLDGSYTVVFTLYTAETGGMTLWGETQAVDFEDGLFRVYLGSTSVDGMEITDFIDNQDVWLGIRVGTDGEMNRVRLASVPWAFEAETCGQVTDLAAAGIQGAIGADACGANQAMRGWTGSAAVCVDLPDVGGLVADSDIGVTVQAPIDQALLPCNYGIQQIGVNGGVVCANQDVVTQCGPDAGLGSLNNYLGSDGICHPAVHSCSVDQYLSGGATGVCQEAPHKCTADQYLDGDGTCQEAPHKCAAGQYLDGSGSCVALAVSGTTGTLARFTSGTAVGNSIITQSGTTGITVGGTATVTGAATLNGVTTVNNYLVSTGGVRVGSASNPGANNLSVAGNAQVGGNLGIGVSPEVDLHVVGNVKMLAEPASRDVNTIYTEGSDGFLHIVCAADTGEMCHLLLRADTNAAPTTPREQMVHTAMQNATTIPIRRDWNWRVDNMSMGAVTVTMTWTEMGI